MSLVDAVWIGGVVHDSSEFVTDVLFQLREKVIGRGVWHPFAYTVDVDAIIHGSIMGL